MTERRRYTKRQKVSAVTAAVASSTLAAAEQMGVPESTLRYWMNSPRFAEIREKAREAVSEGAPLLAVLAQQKLAEAIIDGRLEPRDLVMAYGIAIDKSQLLGGHATERLEHRELDVFDDHETRAIVEGARRYLAGDTAGEGEAVATDAAVEGAGS